MTDTVSTEEARETARAVYLIATRQERDRAADSFDAALRDIKNVAQKVIAWGAVAPLSFAIFYGLTGNDSNKASLYMGLAAVLAVLAAVVYFSIRHVFRRVSRAQAEHLKGGSMLEPSERRGSLWSDF